MRKLEGLLFQWSKRPWLIAAWAALTFVSLLGLQLVGDQLRVRIGVPPFDLQTPLRLEQMVEQLPLYTSEARRVYLWFVALDTVFPVAAGVMLSLILAAALRNFDALRQRPLNARWLVLLPLIGTVLDWLENVWFILSIWSGPGTPWASLAVWTKGLKVAVSVGLISGGVLAFAVFVGAWWLLRNLRRGEVDGG